MTLGQIEKNEIEYPLLGSNKTKFLWFWRMTAAVIHQMKCHSDTVPPLSSYLFWNGLVCREKITPSPGEPTTPWGKRMQQSRWWIQKTWWQRISWSPVKIDSAKKSREKFQESKKSPKKFIHPRRFTAITCFNMDPGLFNLIVFSLSAWLDDQ